MEQLHHGLLKVQTDVYRLVHSHSLYVTFAIQA